MPGRRFFPLVLTLCALALLPLGAPAQVTLDFRCTLELPPEPILPFETLGFVVVLTNHGERTAGAIDAWQLPVSIGQRGEDGAIAWQPYVREGYQAPERPSRYPVQLKPGESQRWPKEIDLDNATRRHVFAQPGEYFVKVQAGLFESAPCRVVVRAPEGADAAAFQELAQADLPRVLNDNGIRCTANKQGIDARLDAFIAAHPASRYAQWAQVSRALLTLANGPFFNGAKARPLLLELAQRAAPPVQAQAYYHVGDIARVLRQPAEAISAFQLALAAAPNPATRLRAENHLKVLQPPAP